MRLFSRLSLRARLALVMTAVLAVITLSIFVYMPSRLERQAFNALRQKAAALGEMTAAIRRLSVVMMAAWAEPTAASANVPNTKAAMRPFTS